MLPNSFTVLDCPIPPQFEQAVGYPGHDRYFALFWFPGSGELNYRDSRDSGILGWAGWLTFYRHPAINQTLTKAKLDFGAPHNNASTWFVLDTEGRRGYSAPFQSAAEFIVSQYPDAPIDAIGHTMDELMKAVNQPARPPRTRIDVDRLMAEQSHQMKMIRNMQSWLNEHIAD